MTTLASPASSEKGPGGFWAHTTEVMIPTSRRILPRGITILLLLYLVLLPLGVLIAATFNVSPGGFGALPFSAESRWAGTNYASVFDNARTLTIVVNTLILSAGSLAIGFAISLAVAWLVERTDFPLRGMVFVLMIASLGIPGFISAISWSLLLNPNNGMINVFLRFVFHTHGQGPLNVYSMAGMIFVQGVGLVPVTFLLITAALRAIDVSLEEAAAMSGARPRTTALRVTAPLMALALAGTFVYQLANAAEAFDVPATLGFRAGIPVLSTEVWLQAQPSNGLPDYGIASTYGVLLIAIVAIPLAYYERTVSRAGRYATVSGNTYRERRIALRPGAKIIGGVLVSVFVLVSLVLPGLTVLYTSLQKYYSVPSWSSLRRSSLDAYRDLFTDPTMLSVLKTTLLVALVTAVLTMVLSSVVSWFVIRSRPRFGRLMDSLAFVPHMLPSIVLGLAVLLIYVRIPAPIYGTMWIMVIALGTRYISLGTRQMNSGIGAIRAELEEAAAMSGASAVKTFRRVVLPLSLPSMANGFLLVSLLSIQNLSVPLLLGSGGNSVISVTIFNNWYNGETANPAALSTVLILVTIILAIAIRRASSLTRM